MSAPLPTQLASHHRRLYALLLDAGWIITVLHLLDQLLLGEGWDLKSNASTFGGWHWLVGLLLLILRDLPSGCSLGKWICAIQVVSVQQLDQAPTKWQLCWRNVCLVLLLPIEMLWVLINPYYRRLGDIWVASVVVRHTSPTPPLRRLSAVAAGYFLLLLVALSLISWNVHRTAAYQTAVSYARQHPLVLAEIGEPIAFGWLIEVQFQQGMPDAQALVRLPLKNQRKTLEIALRSIALPSQVLSEHNRQWQPLSLDIK